MKTHFLPLLASFFLFVNQAQAEDFALPFGADAPDFTLTDLDGVSHTLYDYLDAGKTVIIDFSATWCGPCWNYHNTHILADLYDLYGPQGSDEIMVFFIEADPTTPVSALYGGPGSQGNWVAGTPYPIMDDTNGSVSASFSITYYPTLYAVCPNRKVYEVGQASQGVWENWMGSCSLDQSNAITDAHCFGEASGSIDLSPTGGFGNLSYSWSNGSNTQDINTLAPGVYTCTITEGQGHKIETGDLIVGSPPELLISSNTVLEPGCFGESTGSIFVQAAGGAPGYNYSWSNGGSGQTVSDIPAGGYSVNVIDNNGCQITQGYVLNQPLPLISNALVFDENCGNADGTIVMQPSGGTFPYMFDIGNGPTAVPIFPDLEAGSYPMAVIDNNDCLFNMTIDVAEVPAPNADAGPSAVLDCVTTETILDGTASESGSNIVYEWITSDGDIVSGEDTTTPTVASAGTYEIIVIDQSNGCTNTASVVITENIVLPTADAGTASDIDCGNTIVALDGSGSSQGSGITYLWTTTDGNILSGENSLTPEVDAAGTYVLEVFDGNNGCLATADIVVAADLAAPISDAGPDMDLTCVVSELSLDGTNSDSGSNIQYDWTTPDGNIVDGGNTATPLIDATGTYLLAVTDLDNGCVSYSTTEVLDDMIAPIADAGPDGVLNCNNTTLVLDGTNSDMGTEINHSWTTADGNIVSGENTTQPTIDAPGLYEILVVDTDNGCEAVATVQVALTIPVEVGLDSQTDILCAGESTGSVTIIATEGSQPYSYSWSSGGTAATESDLPAGLHSVTVTDADNCVSTMDVEIMEPDPLSANTTSTNENSAGGNDGTATANPDGGVGPFTYEWSTGETTQMISDLAPDTYTVTVMDVNGCTVIESITVNEFTCSISAGVEGTDVTCNGAGDGEAIVDISNATEPYQIQWSSGGTEIMETDLTPGTYTVSITDANNCPTTANITITEPSVVGLSLVNMQDTDCFGNANGSAMVEGSGGVGNFDYLWPSGNTEASEGDLAAGIYIVTTTDENGCEATLEVLIDQPDQIEIPFDVTHESANDANDGSATLNPTGGTPPFDYEWFDGQTTATISSLAPGTYSATVSDENGCEEIIEVTIEPYECPFIDLSPMAASVSCFGGSDGTATVDIDGGDGPYSYNWSTGSMDEMINELPAGNYDVTVTDANNCPVETSVSVIEPAVLDLGISSLVDIECPGQQTGEATVEAEGGTPGYEYEWSTGATGDTAQDLPPGVHTVSVTDLNGCTDELDVTIIESEDDTPPVINAVASLIIYLDGSGEAMLTTNMVNIDSYDNCGDISLALDQTQFDCSNVGVQTVVLTALDANDNESTALIQVEVQDAIEPEIICPPNVVALNCDGYVEYSLPVAFDNCLVSELNLIDGLGSGSNFPIGTTTEVYEVTDQSGNSNTCSFDVTIDNTLLADTESGPTCEGESTGFATVIPTGGTPVYNYLWENGEETASIFNLVGGEYPVTVTDATGCEFETIIEVEEYPGASYDVVEVVNEENGNGGGSIDVSVGDGTPPYSYDWMDAYGNIIGNDEDIDGLSAGFYTLQVTDANGCIIITDPFIIENVVGIDILESGFELSMYPVPVENLFQIDLSLEQAASIEVTLFDVTGRIMQTEHADKADLHQWTWQLQDLPSGVYWVRILVDEKMISRKLIKQ